jgi:hypothetical protein
VNPKQPAEVQKGSMYVRITDRCSSTPIVGGIVDRNALAISMRECGQGIRRTSKATRLRPLPAHDSAGFTCAFSSARRRG